MQSSPRQHPLRLVGTPSRERGRAATFQLQRTGYLQGLSSCCHLLWDSQPPQSTGSHMLRCVFPRLASCSQQVPKGILQSLCSLQCCQGSVGRVHLMPVHTTPPITREGRGKQPSHACHSAPEGPFHKFQGWKTSKNLTHDTSISTSSVHVLSGVD